METLGRGYHSGDCDFQKKLTVIALQRRLQEIAHQHASHQKFDTDSFCKGDYHWVLGRLSLELYEDLPRWKESYSMQTEVTG